MKLLIKRIFSIPISFSVFFRYLTEFRLVVRDLKYSEIQLLSKGI